MAESATATPPGQRRRSILRLVTAYPDEEEVAAAAANGGPPPAGRSPKRSRRISWDVDIREKSRDAVPVVTAGGGTERKKKRKQDKIAAMGVVLIVWLADEDCLAHATKGMQLLKVRNGVTPRFFFLSNDHTLLQWFSQKAKGQPRSSE